MISVIVPYFKNIRSIRRTLQSALNQSYFNIEILVINDCSPDKEDLESVVKDLNDSRISIIHHAKNKNGAAARNTGMDNSSGEFIAFLDADDEWHSTHLEYMLELFKNYSKEEKICGYPISLIKTLDYPELILPLKPKGKETISEYLFLKEGFIQSSGLFLRSSVNVRWNESLIRHQDYDFLFKLEKAGYIFRMVEKLSVTIDWEGNEITKKGGTWEYSLNYYNNAKSNFSKKSAAAFIFKNCIQPLLKSRDRKKAAQLNKEFSVFSSLSRKMKLTYIDLYFFSKPTLISVLSKIKSALR